MAEAALALLQAESRHGYELYDVWRALLGGIWDIGRSRLYQALNTAAAEGLITITVVPQHNRPPRKIYTATETGVERARAWLAAPVAPPRRIRVELLAKLTLIRHLNAGTEDQLLAAQSAVCRAALDHLRAEDLTVPERADAFVAHVTRTYRITQLEANVAWIASCRTLLERGV